MSRSRFLFLATCLRFDVRENRSIDGRLAPIREIWEKFIANCKLYYAASNEITVDEQLLSFRGRCKFRMYIKSKPDKYGIKIITMNDAKTFYLVILLYILLLNFCSQILEFLIYLQIHGIPYLGKTGHERQKSSGEFFFKQVTEAIHGSGRSIVCDNWFTTIPLMKEVFKDPYNMNITGTIRKNKPDIPNEMKISSKQPPFTQFCHHDEITLASFTPKQNKIVLVVSNKVSDTKVGPTNKPEVILYYNKHKGGTDVFDKLCHAYSTTRSTKRWPMRFFFGMLDQASVNARILYSCKYLDDPSKKLSAKNALNQVTMHLIKPQLLERLKTPNLPVSLRKGFETILGIKCPLAPNDERPNLKKRLRCGLCNYKQDRKTNNQCPSCKRPMCDTHRVYMCNDCVEYIE